jgi:hypothetical protein
VRALGPQRTNPPLLAGLTGTGLGFVFVALWNTIEIRLANPESPGAAGNIARVNATRAYAAQKWQDIEGGVYGHKELRSAGSPAGGEATAASPGMLLAGLGGREERHG